MTKLHTEETWICTIILKYSEITPCKVLFFSGSYPLD